MHIVNKWLKVVQQLVIPSYCLLCMQRSQQNLLCALCEKDLPWLKRPCLLCAVETPMGVNSCWQCQKSEPAFDKIAALFDYHPPIKNIIQQFKYRNGLYFAPFLAKLMIERFKPTFAVDCVVPMPLHPQRQRLRGFNQTTEIAKIIAKKLKLPLDKRSCTRKWNGPPQSTLSAKSRQVMMAPGLFTIAKNFHKKQVLVIEDVVTTGATVAAFAKALKLAGAQRVEIWACCRTSVNKA